MILDQFGFSRIRQNGQSKGFLAYFADSGKRKIADLRDFGLFWSSQKATKMAKKKGFFGLFLLIAESAKLQIFVLLDHFGLPKNFRQGQNTGVFAYFADSGKRKIAVSSFLTQTRVGAGVCWSTLGCHTPDPSVLFLEKGYNPAKSVFRVCKT